jgi:arylsulfatase A-like enzyme
MISALDDGVGRILDKLAEIGAVENTLVIFTSDNGGPETSDADGRCNAPFTGHKRYLYEGGIREPFLMRWPARLAKGTTYTEMVSTLDFMPTFHAVAGGEPPKARDLDGINLLPYLLGEKSGAPHDALYWRSGQNGAMRQGSHKLLLFGEGDRARLYDLASDVDESEDLSAKQPEVVKRMRKAWDAWNAQLQPPRRSGRSVVTRHNGDEVRWEI